MTCTTPLPDPVITKGYEPIAVPTGTLMYKVELPEPLVTTGELKLARLWPGRPATVKVTSPAPPLMGLRDML